MRFKTIQNVLDKKFDTLPLEGILAELLGQPEANGLWLIYGAEKHGKTTLSLILADELSKLKKIGYVMAEQGFDKDFQDVLKRLSIAVNNKRFMLNEYIAIAILSELLKKRNQPDIIFLDNATVYQDELKGGMLHKLIKSNPNKLFILLAHEENGEPYTSTAKMGKKLAKRIIRVEGNRATVEGRSQGGSIIIDEEKAQLYHGTISN